MNKFLKSTSLLKKINLSEIFYFCFVTILCHLNLIFFKIKTPSNSAIYRIMVVYSVKQMLYKYAMFIFSVKRIFERIMPVIFLYSLKQYFTDIREITFADSDVRLF